MKKEITILLDDDAIIDSSNYTDYFMKNNIKVRNIIPEEKDAADMGFENTTNLIKQTEWSRWDDIVTTKLKSI